MAGIRKAALIGGGVIGAGWAARLVLNGIDVALYDPAPETPRRTGEVLDLARKAWARLFEGARAPEGRLSFAGSLAEAVTDADFVQESLPEDESLKVRMLTEASRLARADAMIASSTSGLLPSRLQAGMTAPERFVVAHPFNPVYLLPLVEICGGEKTSPGTRERAMALYRSLGMEPLAVGPEIDGFIADRLLEALWREALWLVHDGVATTAQVDDAIRYGAGLRWAMMGTFLTYRIAGGEAGMRHFMAQFGPALKWPWSKLTDVPELTPEFVDRIAAQSDRQADGLSVRALEARRDDCLVAILTALRAERWGAGETVARHEEVLWDRAQAAAIERATDTSQPLRLHETHVAPEWIDYNGHMTESRYLHVFGNASDALFRHVGIDAAYHASGRSYYTVESHIMNYREVAVGAGLHVTTQILAVDPKRLHIFHRLYRTEGETLLATAEQMLLHVDTKAGRAAPADPAVEARLNAIAAAQGALPRPPEMGRRVGERRG